MKIIKNNRIVITIIMLLIIILCLLLFYRNKKSDELFYTNIYSITNSGAKEENIKAYIDATYIDKALANYKTKSNFSFYVVFDGKVQYLVYMKNSDAKKIRNYLLDHPDETYRIIGETKVMPSGIEEDGIKFIKEWVDLKHHHEEEHSHDIQADDFYNYFGYVYLDNSINKYHELTVLNGLIWSIGLASIILVSKVIYSFIIEKE